MAEHSDWDDAPPMAFDMSAMERAVGDKKVEETNLDFLTRMRNSVETQIAMSGSGCKNCKGIGHIRREGLLSLVCDCRLRPFIHQKLAEAQIPPQFFGMTLEERWWLRQGANGDNLSKIAHREKVFAGLLIRQWMKVLPFLIAGECLKYWHDNSMSKVRSLEIRGGRNSGKSLLLSIIVQAALNFGYTAKIFSWSEIVDAIGDFEKRPLLEEMLEEFRSLDLAVIDGLTGDYSVKRDHLRLGIDRFIQSRLSKDKLIVISSYDDFDLIIDETKGLRSLRDSCFRLKIPSPN